MITELLQRFFSKTPAFFKKLQVVLLAVAAASVGMLAFPQYLPSWFWLPESLKIGSFCGFFGTFIAQLTITQPPNNTTV